MYPMGESRFQAFRKRLEQYHDIKLVCCFNREVGKMCWGSARAEFLSALRSEFLRRGIDLSGVGGPNSLSLKEHVRLEDGKLVTVSN